MKEYVLASASPRRREILDNLGIDFDIVISNANEDKIDKNSMPINLYVQELALIKAAAAAEVLNRGKNNKSIIISADTVVCCDNKILGKPKNKEDAFNMLSMLSGRSHEVYSGICVMRMSDGFAVADYEKTSVTFKKLSPDTIKRYIETNEPMDKAGAYAIQGKGAVLIEKLNGDYFNVVGLPVSKLADVLKKDFDKAIL